MTKKNKSNDKEDKSRNTFFYELKGEWDKFSDRFVGKKLFQKMGWIF